jgi:pimeloyl-ACP methyl ester carboxylesterase
VSAAPAAGAQPAAKTSGMAKRTFDDWWKTVPEDLRNKTRKGDEVNKPLLNQVNYILLHLHLAGKHDAKPTHEQLKGWLRSGRTINVNVSDPNNPTNKLVEISIHLYRPPVILIHGLWENSDNTWVTTNFANKLADKGFYYAFADYEEHNSETFDLCDKVFGNYGINSIRNTIHNILKEYHYFSIAASQVDIVAHSMGGLMARGFVQQPDYKGKENYMKGSIHRLITIGTPHFGGPLSKFLYDRHDYWYFFDGIKPTTARTCKVEPKKLRTIYSDNFTPPIPIDKGGIEALIPVFSLKSN